MMKFKVIGCGAAGNKAAIDLIKSGFDKDSVVLINSTLKDVNPEFKQNAILFGQNSGYFGGCGKERSLGKELLLTDLKNNRLNLDGIIDPADNAVIIVSSTEGGTGSAISPLLAKYFSEVVGKPVILVLFFGFNSDVRGMQNSIEISQELSDNYAVIGISNEKFLDNSTNSVRAEHLANEKFCSIVRTLSGADIHDGSQNIDDTDLYKIISTPGFMIVDSADITKVKSVQQFNDAISQAIASSKYIESSDKGAKRIGVIYNIDDSMQQNIDFQSNILKNTYGIPYEQFIHIQAADNRNIVTWIISGLPLPMKEIKSIYENYKKESEMVKKSKDSFFEDVGKLRGNVADAIFDTFSNEKEQKSKNAFLADFGLAPTQKLPSGKAVIKKE